MSQNQMPDDPLQELLDRRRIWAEKPQLRLCYERWAAMMRPYLAPGGLLEVGSGSGLSKELFPEVLLCDIVRAPWLDFRADCMRLPVGDSSIENVIAFDLLHHAADPHSFLTEAARVLKPGGRILLMEPYITPVSYVGYKALHHEDVYFGGYHKIPEGGAKVDPWQGNLAVANVVFNRMAAEWETRQPDLRIVRRDLLSFFDFQMAAGFKPRAYVPMGIYRLLVKLDDVLGLLMPLLAFRIFLVLEKKS
ncbi:MAG: class I SAM-dependent methyltransferase [Candidatus Sumerlaeaceae bacterium]|nr:class I SAM-dependent methyltransferase [Candidatus Sumerlaeaceae bacterium]